MKTVIAIDGPAASGKSSAAKRVAARLGFAYVNSGSFYRAITWRVLQDKVDTTSEAAVEGALHAEDFKFSFEADHAVLLVQGQDPDEHLREEAVNQNVSAVSRVPAVRAFLLERLRSLADERDLVMEGRDIGSVVFPGTPYKFYVDASPEVRRQRREAQGHFDEIATRDRIDSSRANAPLVTAKDAKVIDSTHLGIEEVVAEILAHLKSGGLSVSA